MNTEVKCCYTLWRKTHTNMQYCFNVSRFSNIISLLLCVNVLNLSTGIRWCRSWCRFLNLLSFWPSAVQWLPQVRWSAHVSYMGDLGDMHCWRRYIVQALIACASLQCGNRGWRLHVLLRQHVQFSLREAHLLWVDPGQHGHRWRPWWLEGVCPWDRHAGHEAGRHYGEGAASLRWTTCYVIQKRGNSHATHCRVCLCGNFWVWKASMRC